jgi:hypothetical protein
MSVGAAAGASAAAGAAITQAIRAAGVIVRVEAPDFLAIVRRHGEPLVVHAMCGMFTKHHQYLTSYKGLAFYVQGPDPIQLPAGVELVEAKRMWVPG